MKNRFYKWSIIIIAIILLVILFALNGSLSMKILIPTVAIGILARFIENKRIRYLIVFICLLVMIYLFFWLIK